MKTNKFLSGAGYLFALLAISSLTFISCDDDNNTGADTQLNIVETAQANDNFSILAQAIVDADLDVALSAQGPFTVFAPTNDAFNDLPEGLLAGLSQAQLAEILQYHVVAGEIRSGDLQSEQQVAALTEGTVFVTVSEEGQVLVNNTATVLTADIETSNGIIHAIDGVILPNDYKTIVGIAQKSYELTTLVELVAQAGLVTTLESEGPFTAFAPTNEAFAEVSATLQTLNEQQVQEVLTYHVAAAQALSTDLSDGQTIETVQGENITITIENGNVVLNGNVTVIAADQTGTNGVVHVINGVLLPPSFSADEATTASVTIDNVGASAWEFTALSGNGAGATLNEENTTLSLTTGTRVTFTNNGGSSHPLEFRAADGTVLLAQNSTNGSLEGNSDVDFQVNGSEVSFTVTPELADALASYYCSVHAGMNGSVSIQ